MKRRILADIGRRTLLMAIIFSLVATAAGCDMISNKSTSFDIDSIKSYRDIPGITEEEISAIEKLRRSHKSLSYGQMLETESFILPDGTYAGFTALFCELLSNIFDIQFVQKTYDWDGLINGIDNKTIDFTGDLAPTPERMQFYHMTNSIAERSLKAYLHETSPAITSESDLKGLKVGFLINSVDAALIAGTYPNLLFDTIYAKNLTDAAQLLESGEIDVFITEGVIDPIFDEYSFIHSKNIFRLLYTPVSLTTANSDLKPIISVVNKYITAGGTDTLAEMYSEGDQQYAKYKLNKSFSDEEKAYLEALVKENKKVRIALEPDNYPVSFYNEKEEEFQGIAPDVLAEISHLTGIGFNTVTEEDTSWAGIIEMLGTGDVSMVSQLLRSEERKKQFIWHSVPYTSAQYILLSKSDYPNLATHQVAYSTVGIVRKTAQEEMYKKWFPDNDNVIYYDSQNEALDALERDEIDLLMASENRLLAQTNYREKAGYKANIIFNEPLESYFGFNRDETILCSIIDKSLAFIKTDSISRSWTSRVFDYSREFANMRMLYLTIFSVALLLVLISVLLLLLHNKKISNSLEKQTTTLSAIYTSIPDMIFCKDVNGNYTSCNSSFENFAGLKEADIVGKNAIELFGARDAQMAEHFMTTDSEALSANATMTLMEEWFTYSNGSRRLFETIKTPLMQGELVIGLVGISRDITEHKIAENDALAASNSKSAFLAHMSHEIRTPMNAIIGMTELILRDKASKRVHENALFIKQASADMLSLINDILDFSKIEAGKLNIMPEEYSFDSLINDVISIIRMRITDKSVFFVANVDCNIPNRLVGDEIRIRQILLNLLSNAVKFTNEGFISLTVTSELKRGVAVLTFEISDSGIGIDENDSLKLFDDFVQVDTRMSRNVEGTGLGLTITKRLCHAMNGNISLNSEPGIGSTFTVTLPQQYGKYEKLADVENPEQKQVLLYEPRAIYANSIISSIDNLGASCTLAVTQSDFHEELRRNPYPFVFVASFLFDAAMHVIEGLELNSKLVFITEFGEVVSIQNIRTISMPIYSVPIANILNDVSDNISYHENDSIDILFTAPTARLLIVDDVSTNLKVAEGLISPYKMQIDTCKSGAEAIRLVQANRYDAIFMDHMMPCMDGIETTGKIRAIEDEGDYYKNLPIIALTANAVSGMREMFLNNGLNDFLAKPIETSKLNSILRKWIPKEKQEKYIKEKTMSAAPINLEIEGVNVNAGILMIGGLTTHYLKTLSVFYDDGLKKINELRDCLRENDLKLYTTHIHALKSASMSIGATKLSELAKTLEIAAKNGSAVFIMENTEDFLKELSVLLQNINIALTKNQLADIKIGEKDLSALKNEVVNLKAALENMNAREINNIMNDIENKTWDKATGDLIKKISQQILLFEYSEAIKLIDELLE